MIVEAVRDDGALLVTAGGNAALIVADGNTYVTTTTAALARGDWSDPTPDAVVPVELRDRVRTRLAEVEDEVSASLPPRDAWGVNVENVTVTDGTTAEERDDGTIEDRAARVHQLRERVNGDA